MKFRPLEDFRHGRTLFEAENWYDSDKHGLTSEEVTGFHAAGWAEVDGMDAPPPRKPGAQRLTPQSGKHRQSEG